jgi:protein disulfide-isomerase A6
MRAFVLAFVLALAAAESLYDFADSPLIQLEDSTFEHEVVKDDAHLWVVEYYADWCGHCKQFAKGFQKAAVNLDGLVKFGAVNADNSKKTTQAAGVQGYPSVKLYVPGTGGRNPYTGKSFKPALDYSGPRTAKGVVEFATASMPSEVVPVTDKTLTKFKGNGTLPKALLFTQKAETPLLLKSLSVAFSGRMLLGEVRDTAKAATAEFGVSTFPTLMMLPADGAAPIKYEGEMKPKALSAFLETHAAEMKQSAAASKEGATSGSAGDDLAVTINAANVEKLVEGERDAWILVFAGTESADLPDPGVGGLAEALYGQVKVGRASADLADKFGVKVGPQPTMITYPSRKPGVKRKASKSFGASDGDIGAAKKAALESLPDNMVEKLHAANIDKFMQEGMQTTEAKAFTILFSDKATIPPLFRAISLAFEGKLSFGMAQASDTQIAQRFNNPKAPALMVMFPDDSKADASTGQVPLTGMQFTPQMHGKFNFGNIANFLSQVVTMRTDKDASSKAGASDGNSPSASKRESSDVKGPLPELSADNFDKECVNKGGLCAIALLDGAPENSASKESNLEMLTKLRKRKAGGPLSFSWIDATCHTAFAAAFELSEMDLPTMVYLSPTKLKWARAIGAFDAETLGGFGSLVAAGKKATNDISALPSIDEIDCSTVKRGAAAYEEEVDDGADDIMKEILEEERREREAREAELAAEGGEAAPTGGEKVDKSKMSKLERMELELEECEAMDLLCGARREKQQKAIDKERALQEKLAAIKKKNKKKKKKANKA